MRGVLKLQPNSVKQCSLKMVLLVFGGEMVLNVLVHIITLVHTLLIIVYCRTEQLEEL